MKKRTLRKSNLDELAKEMPIIGEIEQQIFVGGGDGSVYNPYTQFEYECMLYSGSWTGGYVLDEVVVTATYIERAPTGEGGTMRSYSNYYQFQSPTILDALLGIAISYLPQGVSDWTIAVLSATSQTVTGILGQANYPMGTSFYVETFQNGGINVYNNHGEKIGEYSVLDYADHIYMHY